MSVRTDTIQILPEIQTDSEKTFQEEIIKPSPEHIPDEYEHNDNASGKVFVLHTGFIIDVRNIENNLQRKFKNIGYDLKDEDVICYRTEDDINKACDEILKTIQNTKPLFLIIFFFGKIVNTDKFLLEENKSICTTDIWNKFTSDKCSALKNIPKCFIFEGRQKRQRLLTDGPDGLRKVREERYDVPAEADILLVFKLQNGKTDDGFYEEFCDNIESLGRKDDIITLITLTKSSYARPLIISTLTRKFYVTASDTRGYHYEHELKSNEIKKLLQEVKSNRTETET